MTELKSSWRVRWATLAIALLLVVTGAPAAMSFLMHSEDPGDCATCHGDAAVLPEGHVPTAGMKLEGCVTCHAPDTPLDLHSAIPLDHHHLLSGVTCQACHGSAETPAPMSTSQCLACHGPLEALAELTKDVKPTNPHWSPHGATYTQCDLCHQVHKPSEDFCAQCHDFNFKVP